MKTIILFALSVYKVIVSPLLHALLGQKTICRYTVSCSSYAKDVIMEYGVLKGGSMALRRFVSCQPFAKPYANL